MDSKAILKRNLTASSAAGEVGGGESVVSAFVSNAILLFFQISRGIFRRRIKYLSLEKG